MGGFSIQPSISKDLGPIEVGVWSSYTLDGTSAGAELDLYVSGSIGSFDVAVTNYSYPGAAGYEGAFEFEGGPKTGLEASVGTSFGDFSIMGGFFFDNEDL